MKKLRVSARYEPLRELNQFRLLELQPGSPNEPIRCSLTVAEIPQPEIVTFTTSPYQALSYVWGEDTPSHEILIDGWYCLVRENLFQFLIHHRHPEISCTLWIDALCIDQANLRERSLQVQSMGEIYKAASKVLVWLGSASPETDIAMDCFKETYSLSQGSLPRLNNTLLRALASWGQVRYWSRTWVIQEFLHAQGLVLICGVKQMDWFAAISTYEVVLEHLRTSKSHDWIYDEIRRSPALVLLSQRRTNTIGKVPLAELIISNRESTCLEPRDKVYAFLSLASKFPSNETITVDYSANVETIFYEVMRVCKDYISTVNATVPFGCLLVYLLRLDSLLLNRSLRFNSDSTFQRAVLPRWVPSNGLVAKTSSESYAIMFNVGYIVFNDTLAHLRTPITSSAVDSPLSPHSSSQDSMPGRLSIPSRAPDYISTSDLQKLMCQLENLDLRRLFDETNTLHEISTRSWGRSNEKSTNSIAPPPAFSLVIAYFAHYKTKRFAIGLAYGGISNGDTVAQQPGYETAFTLRPGTHMTGRVLFARSDEPWIEPLTGKTMDFQALKTEAELSSPSHMVKLLMNPRELLSLLTLR